MSARYLAGAATVGIVASFSSAAIAQVSVQLNASSNAIEQGDAVQIQLSATGGEEAMNSPRLSAPAGFVVMGPTVGSSQQVSFSGAGIERTVTLTATWRVSATQLGEFNLGPATVNIGGKTLQSKAIKLRVVAKGSLPRRAARRRGASPFDDDFFQNFMRPGRSLFGDLLEEPQPEPEIPAEYKLDSAPDPYAFLRATLVPTKGALPSDEPGAVPKVVVGEQLTLRIYAYGGLGRFGEALSHEARRPDFYSVATLDPNQRFYPVSIGERQYLATKVREIALFPMKAGRLEISPMSMAFYGQRYVTQSHPAGVERQSPSLFVDVSEPPSAGRPTGYQLGDVGDFTLSANVSERRVPASGSLIVQATLSGTGNLPNRLSTPDQRNVEWGEPSIRDEIKPNDQRQIGGTRTFTYLVHFTEPGNYALGALNLHAYDPALGTYKTARAELGDVEVKATTPSNAATDTPEAAGAKQPSSIIAALEPAKALTNAGPTPAPISDATWYWSLLFAVPGLSLFAHVANKRWSHAKGRRKERAQAPSTLANKALSDAEAALKKNDTGACVTQLERALFCGLEASTGLAARGVLRAELQAKLVAKGLATDLAETSTQLLSRLENARFAGGAESPAVLTSDVRAAVRRLLKAA